MTFMFQIALISEGGNGDLVNDYIQILQIFNKCPVFDRELQFEYLRIVKVFCVDCFYFIFMRVCVFVFACLKEFS